MGRMIYGLEFIFNHNTLENKKLRMNTITKVIFFCAVFISTISNTKGFPEQRVEPETFRLKRSAEPEAEPETFRFERSPKPEEEPENFRLERNAEPEGEPEIFRFERSAEPEAEPENFRFERNAEPGRRFFL